MEDFTCLPPPGGCGWRKHNNTDYEVGRPIEVASVIELSEASGRVAAGLFMTEG